MALTIYFKDAPYIKVRDVFTDSLKKLHSCTRRVWEIIFKGYIMKKYKAILFDLDGTLLDSLKDIAVSMNAVLESLGFPQHPIDNYRTMVGDGVPMLAKRVLPQEARSESSIQECVSKMREEYAVRWDVYTQPYPGIEAMLAAVEKADISKSVFSNKPDNFTQLAVSKFLASFTFSVVLGLKEGVPKKPNPSGALDIAKQVSIDPSEFLYVGDTNTDMQTASAAGMFPLGVQWGFRDKKELLENGALALVTRPDEILNFI